MPYLRDVFHQPTPAQGRLFAQRLIDTLPSCAIPEIARLGKTLRRWKTVFLAYFDTDGASNGGTEAVNGIIELGRRIARGFRNFEHYRLRMLLITGGPDASPTLNSEEPNIPTRPSWAVDGALGEANEGMGG